MKLILPHWGLWELQCSLKNCSVHVGISARTEPQLEPSSEILMSVLAPRNRLTIHQILYEDKDSLKKKKHAIYERF